MDADAQAHFKRINKRNQLNLTLEVITGFEPQNEAPAVTLVDTSGNGGIKGKRPSKKDKLRAFAAGQNPVGSE